MRNRTIVNFEDYTRAVTVAVGAQADAMVRNDAAYWAAQNELNKNND